MKRPIKIMLIILTAISTLLFITMVAVCVAMQIKYFGKNMGNEASGFFSAACLLTFVIGIPTVSLWMILLKKRKKI